MHQELQLRIATLEKVISEAELMTNPWIEKSLGKIKEHFEELKRGSTRDAKKAANLTWKYSSLIFLGGLALFLSSHYGFASVESSLAAVQAKLVGTILPLVAIVGLILAGLSFVLGSPNARTHLVLAIIGCLVGFGAQSLVAFIRGLVN